VCLTGAVFGDPRPFTEKEVDDVLEELIKCEKQSESYKNAYTGCIKLNSELRAKISEDKKTSKTARYILAGVGAWGIATGGIYPVATGCFFLLVAIR